MIFKKLFLFSTVCVYVGLGCNYGNFLSSQKVQKRMPHRIGPSSIQEVLHQVVDACVSCATQEKQVFDLLKMAPQGSGKISITGEFA